MLKMIYSVAEVIHRYNNMYTDNTNVKTVSDGFTVLHQ